MTDEKDYPTPKPVDRKVPSMPAGDPVVIAVGNFMADFKKTMKTHEDDERKEMHELRQGIRQDFREEAAKIADTFQAVTLSNRKEIAELRGELEKLQGRVRVVEERLDELTGDGR